MDYSNDYTNNLNFKPSTSTTIDDEMDIDRPLLKRKLDDYTEEVPAGKRKKDTHISHLRKAKATNNLRERYCDAAKDCGLKHQFKFHGGNATAQSKTDDENDILKGDAMDIDT